MQCNQCNQEISVCDQCGRLLSQFACLAARVEGDAAQQLGVPDGTLLGRNYHYCPACFQSMWTAIHDGQHRARM